MTLNIKDWPGYIEVILKDGTFHRFTPRVLDVLISTERVQKFKRTSGWTTVGLDPVRKAETRASFCYIGPERRSI